MMIVECCCDKMMMADTITADKMTADKMMIDVGTSFNAPPLGCPGAFVYEPVGRDPLGSTQKG